MQKFWVGFGSKRRDKFLVETALSECYLGGPVLGPSMLRSILFNLLYARGLV